jgi:hypothetical protein
LIHLALPRDLSVALVIGCVWLVAWLARQAPPKDAYRRRVLGMDRWDWACTGVILGTAALVALIFITGPTRWWLT